MDSLKKLWEDQAEALKEMRAINDLALSEKRDFTAEEQEKYDKLSVAFDGYDDKISEIQKQQDRAAQLEKMEEAQESAHSRNRNIGRQKSGDSDNSQAPSGPTSEQRALALQGWCRFGSTLGVTDEQRSAAEAVGLRLEASNIAIRLAPTESVARLRDAYRAGPEEGAHRRAMSVGIGSDGGFTVAEGFQNSLEIALLDFSAMRQAASIIRTATGEDIPWPTSNDTNNEGEMLGENQPVSEQDVKIGSVTMKRYKFSSKMVKLSHELMRDSAFSLAETLGRMLGERIGRHEERKFTDGIGGTEPHGIRNAAAFGISTVAATLIAADEVKDLADSLDPAYVAGASYMSHQNTFGFIGKLKTGTGEYLWQPSFQLGEPGRLNGFPIFKNQKFPATLATGQVSMTFGDHSFYKIRDVGTFRLLRLEERFAEFDQIAFLAFMESDGFLLDAGTGPVKTMVQA